MTDMSLQKARIHAGVWEGTLTTSGTTAPELEVTYQDQALSEVDVAEIADQPGQFSVRIQIPSGLLCDGVQTFLICDKSSGDTLDSFVIVAGQPLASDIRAEMDLLRAELDLLKRSFRRHLRDGGGK
ncbi:hypothetical protein SAMN04488030_2353 [Aliiroseovarius halocynthiae]|uniref:Uncharacterized protein n=1 Tax=Aliiroseovarius halocynthiae TaxID=985055 RepID=A0A545SZI6_9RHOB|nr:hypothetical protein [Aliiroseovarius halocynthiae]TQV70360.1 hypothetical protein FIL88_00180 [Aliiroseovarius halocynthiae]SMR81950.1 hypothetical protein SAMN04488030_2353 [Aliiroseovarius halocynthiae]